MGSGLSESKRRVGYRIVKSGDGGPRSRVSGLTWWGWVVLRMGDFGRKRLKSRNPRGGNG